MVPTPVNRFVILVVLITDVVISDILIVIVRFVIDFKIRIVLGIAFIIAYDAVMGTIVVFFVDIVVVSTSFFVAIHNCNYLIVMVLGFIFVVIISILRINIPA